jgi:endonuclease/exonuclease/phosphatase family metal-dependent hydrolase
MKVLYGGLFVWYSMNMKVTTLNLAGYKNWPDRESNIVSYLGAADSDVVFLQEVKFNPEYSPYSQSRYLNSLLSTPYPYGQTSISRIFQSSQNEESREGLAVLSKYPIIDSEVIVLRKRADDKHTRIIQKVSIIINDRVINFTNVHFSNNEYSDEQLEETLLITKNRNESSIILGDFNIFDIQTVSHLYSVDYVASTEVRKYISFPSEAATFDYILAPKTYRYSSLEIGENLSDHNALTAVFEVE